MVAINIPPTIISNKQIPTIGPPKIKLIINRGILPNGIAPKNIQKERYENKTIELYKIIEYLNPYFVCHSNSCLPTGVCWKLSNIEILVTPNVSKA